MYLVRKVHGPALSASQIGQSMALDYKTINSYLDYLVGAFLIRRLPPQQANMRKRQVSGAQKSTWSKTPVHLVNRWSK